MIYLFIFLIIFFVLAKPVLAVCPLCTVAVGSALGTSRFLGIDDTISSFWIGGLVVSSSLWLSAYLEKKEKLNRFSNPYFIVIIFYFLVLTPLWYTGYIGISLNKLLGVDKILLGTAVGSVVFISSVYADKKVRMSKGGQLFNYQRVVFPLIGLFVVSVISHLLI